MSLELKQAEIAELEAQNAKRNIVTLTSALLGVAIGYFVFTNTKSKRADFFKYLIGGGLVFGVGYRLLTQKKTKRRKEAIEKKTASLEQGYVKPAVASVDSGAAPTTVVDLGAPTTSSSEINKPTGNPDRPHPVNPNVLKPAVIYKN
jgi:hypothetical protein